MSGYLMAYTLGEKSEEFGIQEQKEKIISE